MEGKQNLYACSGEGVEQVGLILEIRSQSWPHHASPNPSGECNKKTGIALLISF